MQGATLTPTNFSDGCFNVPPPISTNSIIYYIQHNASIVLQSSFTNMKNVKLQGDNLFKCNHLGQSL